MRIEEGELRDALAPILATTIGDRDAAWGAVAEAGWIALRAPEASGGLAQPLSAAGWLYMEAGRALSPAPLLPALLAVDAIAACPVSAERDDWLERLAGGERVAASLLDPAAPRPGDGATIEAVEGFAGAGHLLLLAADPALVALVPTAALEAVARTTWDTTRALSDVRVPSPMPAEAIVFARGADAAAAIAAARAHLHFAIAADCVGAADAILSETVAYLHTRRQFDRPLAMFQALKHRCADLKAQIAASEALLRDRLAACEAGGADPVAAARTAKAHASATFRLVAEEAVQLHGGIGMTAEHGCHRYLKRAMLDEHLASGDDACEQAAAAALLDRGR